ncbi:MAG: A/G-specific adenine glycosylase [Pseudomonadaceae bacterium]|nr:A/G-specific adenine glycosylase [Pseudomonadaceae bacterium]
MTTSFADRLLDWWDGHGRKDLPWQSNKTAYRVWLSEVMLQQTQVTTVLPYYQRFLTRFPDVHELARADQDAVLHQWTGLGYYSRARNLHQTAQIVSIEFAGDFPREQDALEALPGIGRSTAAAIIASAYNARGVILDGNVKRVLARLETVDGHTTSAATTKRLWEYAEEHTPFERNADYNQAIMDLGALVCRRSKPECDRCPALDVCKAAASETVDRYPGKKPKKEKPVRQASMFVVRAPSGAVLLEQRTGKGVWQGLWNPPERALQTSAESLLMELGLNQADCLEVQGGSAFRHTFSHYHLDILPTFITLEKQPAAIAEADTRRWHLPEAQGGNEAIGLSAVAVKLLELASNPGQETLL